MGNSRNGFFQLGLALLFLYPFYAIIIILFYIQIGENPWDIVFIKPLIYFFNFVSFLNNLQLGSILVRYARIQHQIMEHRDEIFGLFILFYFLSRSYVISTSKSAIIKFKPLSCLWETHVQFELRDQAVAFNESLLRYLTNKRLVKFGFMVHISKQGNKTIIVGITGRRFIPKTKRRASLEFMGLFHANGLDVTASDQGLNISKTKFHKMRLKFRNTLPS